MRSRYATAKFVSDLEFPPDVHPASESCICVEAVSTPQESLK